jgi:hypothetical protein
MKQERDAEREQTLLRQQAVHTAAAEKRTKIQDVTVRLWQAIYTAIASGEIFVG